MTRRYPTGLVAAAFLAGLPALAQARPEQAAGRTQAAPARLTQSLSGNIPTREGQRLRVVTDVGSVRIHTVPDAREVTYTVRMETDSSQPDAARLLKQVHTRAAAAPDGVHILSSVPWGEFRGRLWVTFDVTVPRNYHLDVTTHAGNVTTEDVDGRVILLSRGGNIQAGRIGAGARLETQGGHIETRDVGGELVALTAGGHITTGHVAGGAVLRTGGGHIKVASIQGLGQVETGGGDVQVEKTGAKLVATSEGGQITFAEAQGPIEARTAGGGIRVLRVTGPMQLQTTAGSIFLTQVQDAVRASTNSGSITAWFAPEWKKAASRLTSGQGDIIVYLPKELALTLDVVIEMSEGRSVVADPRLPLKMSYQKPVAGAAPTLRAEALMNGGGEVLRLHAVGGNIHLRPAEAAGPSQHVYVLRPEDSRRAVEFKQQMENRALAMVEAERRVREKVTAEMQAQAEARAKEQQREMGRLAQWFESFGGRFTRPLAVEPAEQRKKLVHMVRPSYPEFARRNRLEGLVRMEAVIAEDGTVQSVQTLSGHKALAAAAEAAVLQWRYQPTLWKGREVKVVTRIDVEFRLN
jgi:TonB family protein